MTESGSLMKSSSVMHAEAPESCGVDGFADRSVVDSASRYDADSSAGSLSGLRVCVVACHFRPESSGSAPYNSLLVDTLADAGAAVKVVTGVPHYPQWRVVDRSIGRDCGGMNRRPRQQMPARSASCDCATRFPGILTSSDGCAWS